MTTSALPCPTCGASSRGSRGRCKACHARSERERTARTPDVARARERDRKRAWRAATPAADREATRRQRYGLTQAAFDEMLRAQRGRCLVCLAPSPSCVDHDHRTGSVRGLLCRACNAGLGHFRDDPGRLRAAAAYLRRSRTAPLSPATGLEEPEAGGSE